MKLRDRAFEKAVGRQIRRELRASPVLWREYRRVRVAWWRRVVSPHWLPVSVLFVMGVELIGRLRADDGRPEPAVAAIAFWFAGAAAAHSRSLYRRLYDPASILALYHLPLTDDDIFRVRWRVAWRAGAAWSLVYLGLGAMLAELLGKGWGDRSAWLLLPVGQSLLAFVAGLHLAAWVPEWSRLGLVGYALALTVVFAWPKAPGLVEPLVALAPWVPPSGWLNHCAERVLLHHDAAALALLVPVAAVVAAAPASWRRLRRGYGLAEPQLVTGAGEEPADAPAAPQPDDAVAALRREISRPPATGLGSSGWLEQMVWRWWTRRERLVAEFFLPLSPGWSAVLRRLAWAFLPALAAVLLFGHQNQFVIVFGVTLPLVVGAPVLGGTWRGLSKRPAGGQFSPIYALYPIGFWEAFRVMLKANTARVLAAVPFGLALAAAASWRLSGSVETGLSVGLKVALLWLGLQPLVATFRFAEVTNDTQRLRAGRVFLLVPLIAVLLGAGAALFVAETLVGVGIAWLVAVTSGLVLTAAYGRGWARGRFDLLCDRGDDTTDPAD
ncbi:MAG: hypothetical protein IPM17_01850 [Verrucomicrobia bacterium]|nr:hypothetical protein [Verrucomicrobiota bacterium]